MKNKKGVEIAFNTIIIAVIALLVLAVIIYLLYVNVRDVDKGTSCVRLQGHCGLRLP